MVIGLDKFKEYFEQYTDSYIIIGGTACDIIIDEAGFTPRATKDIDIILIVEVLEASFFVKFWEFINDGKYQVREKSNLERQFYRFKEPQNTEFPWQVELFSKIPDVLDIPEHSRYTPIPIDEDITSLSAILMNEDYYQLTINGSILKDGARIAKLETLICLKARAYNDLKAAKDSGENIDSRKIKKHKTDIFRLAVMLTRNDQFELPVSIKGELQEFVNKVKDDLPDEAILKAMGLSNIPIQSVLEQIRKSFQLTE